ncbi:MAG: carboxypeptidase-like regulatory domain-containing protein [Euryarchaeota archaeon]|nr:carboxypeptidase-like regulatory domain-containing protein [Euryarchaeota archaeon]
MAKRHQLGVHLAVVVAASLLFAGCSSAKAKSPPPDPFIQPKGFDEVSGSVSGVVVDEEFFPLRDAVVGFIDPYQATKTDEFGYFEIGMLKPGERNLYVIHLGHKSAGKRITLVEGQTTEVQFILPVLPVEEPWIDIKPLSGWFERAARIDPTGTTYNKSVSPQWRTADDPKVLRALQMDVVWNQGSGLSGGIKVDFGLGGSATKSLFFTLEGKNPLSGSADRARIEEVWDLRKSVCVKEPCRFQWEAAPATKVTNQVVDLGIMLDQRFFVYVAHFYRLDMPPDYHAAPV